MRDFNTLIKHAVSHEGFCFVKIFSCHFGTISSNPMKTSSSRCSRILKRLPYKIAFHVFLRNTLQVLQNSTK